MSLRGSPSASLALWSSARKPVPECGSVHKIISVNGNGLPPAAPRPGLEPGGAGHLLSASLCWRSGAGQGRGLRGVVRPASALCPGGVLSRLRQLQGELVRKRKECEELKQTNNWLAKELHTEKVLLRSESERTMRNLRVLNQELHATIKELRQRTSEAQDQAARSARLASEAACGREEVERARRLAESQEQEVREERDKLQTLSARLREDIGLLQDTLTDVQHRLTLTEENYFESKTRLERSVRENQSRLEEIRTLERERGEERLRTKELMEEVSKLKDKEVVLRRAAAAAEAASDDASRLQYEAERGRRLAEHEAEEMSKEGDLWRHKHGFLSEVLRSQEEEKSKRKNKACQAKFPRYFLCRTECVQRVSVANTLEGSPRSFVEGETAHFTLPVTETDDRQQVPTPERLMYCMASPGSGTKESRTQGYFRGLAPVKHQEISSPSKGRKVVDYFWLPADDGD